MGKRAQTLADKATATALSVDRATLGDLIGKLVAVRQGRKVAELAKKADRFMSDPINKLVRDARDPFASDAAPKVTKRRVKRGDIAYKRVKLLISDIWGSDLRYGSKRYKKLEWVINKVHEREDKGQATFARNLLGDMYSWDNDDKLDAHDLNGMVERGHIKLED